MKLPQQYKVCEKCPAFCALLWDNSIVCSRLGHVKSGVVFCALRGGKDGGVHGGLLPDVRVCPSPDLEIRGREQ